MEIKELRKKTGLSQSMFAQKFHIGIRTLQSWECGARKAPGYVVFMIARIIDLEEKYGS